MNKIKRSGSHGFWLAFFALAIAWGGVFQVEAAPVPAEKNQPQDQATEKKKSAAKKSSAKESGKKTTKQASTTAPTGAAKEPVYAIVNGRQITVQEYKGLLAETARGRYYHGTIPEALAKELYREVGDMLVERELLVQEASRRGIKPDTAKFDKTMADLDARYADQPQWQQQRAQFLPQIKLNAERLSLVEQLERSVRDVPQPTPAEVRAYYDSRQELFTEPEKVRLSIILLKVPSGGSKADWDQAREEARKIHGRIKSSADFAEQARLHSQHDSAEHGGDMAYLHGGMLPRGMEEKIAQLQNIGLNEPIDSLEGIVVPWLENRIPPKLQEFTAVRQRAQELLVRDRADEAWQKTIRSLRDGADIEIVTPQMP